MAAFTQALADLIMQFARERAGTHAGCVSLGNAQHEANRIGPNARPGCGIAGDGIAAGHKGVGAVIHIQHHRLRAFKQHALAATARLIQAFPDRFRKGQQLWRERKQAIQQRLFFEFRRSKPAKQRIVMAEQFIKLVRQGFGFSQIAQANRAPRYLVLIGRANAAPCGADFRIAPRRFACLIQSRMQRQDQWHIIGDAQILRRHGKPLCRHFGDFGKQSFRVQHHAIADNAKLAPHHA